MNSDEEYEHYRNTAVNSEWRELRDIFEDQTYLRLCIEEPLDTIISDKDCIVICDVRDNMYEYSSLPQYEKNKYNNFLVVRSIEGKPITLRVVLNEMMACHYYSRDNLDQSKYLNHIFLESIDPPSSPDSIQYQLFLGS